MSKASVTLLEDDSAFLPSFADATEESPWMVAADPHLPALTTLLSLAQLYVADHHPDLYVSGELAIRFPRGDGTVGQVAPDLFAAYSPRRLRSSFDVAVEGSFPAFVLEVVSPVLPTLAEEREARAIETRRARDEARRADIEARRAQFAETRAALLEAELARLRQGG